MMFSRSCISLLDLASNDMLNFPQTPRSLPRVITVPGIISDAEDGVAGGGPISPLPEPRDKKIIVMNFLPLNAQRDSESSRWEFSLDEDILQLQMKDGISTSSDVIYIGSLKVDVASTEQDEVAQVLLDKFKCVPTFLPPELHRRYYHGFCKQYLWPLFHYMLPMCSEYGNRFERSMWQAYVSANKIYADKVMEVINPEEDYVWVHDYHLMLMPTFLRRRFKKVKLGFFLHSPFPSSEIYRTLPVREEVLRALLNADLIGFHTFDYARHFLSCCSRMLGLNYVSKRGHIGLDYLGRMVYIKILPVGIHMGRIESALDHHLSYTKAMEIQHRFEGKKVILGIDDMDIFKGISLKLLAVEQLLEQNPDLQGQVVLVQIINPARSTGKDVEEAKRETYSATHRINARFGSHNYKPIILIDRPLDIYEKTAYYVVSECCIVNAVRDGMNLVPYKYIACRQGTSKMNESLGIPSDSPRTSMLVVSEFIGCSPSLSGALRVNPWDIDAVSDALSLAIRMPALEKQLRHEKHYRYVRSHDVAYWARSFLQDLERSCKEHYKKRCWGMGFGLNFRILSLSPSFRKLSCEGIAASYKKAKRRAVFLDYDGTLVAQGSMSKVPSPEVISVLNTLSNDQNNTVFIVSGRGRKSLGDWFKDCANLGIAAEHGYFVRWKRESEWDSKAVNENLDWKKIAEPVMDLYTETTDGSYVEAKESALVWHYQDADPDFGSFQAMELLDHLESVLANEPVVVKKGQHIVEVNPQGVTKGLAAEKILSSLIKDGKAPEFVLCIGDDRSDEDMFESISNVVSSSSNSCEVFACTVGQKPSKARYYLDDPRDVLLLLQTLSSESDDSSFKGRGRVESFVSFEKSS